tara:strand:+ start:163 stop:570 length:408 start_codon:yes stop_codon:yes gene_type:complete
MPRKFLYLILDATYLYGTAVFPQRSHGKRPLSELVEVRFHLGLGQLVDTLHRWDRRRFATVIKTYITVLNSERQRYTIVTRDEVFSPRIIARCVPFRLGIRSYRVALGKIIFYAAISATAYELFAVTYEEIQATW